MLIALFVLTVAGNAIGLFFLIRANRALADLHRHLEAAQLAVAHATESLQQLAKTLKRWDASGLPIDVE